MQCYKCDVCGKVLQKSGVSVFCLPVIIGTPDGKSRHCWCVCSECRPQFLNRTVKVLEEQREGMSF